MTTCLNCNALNQTVGANCTNCGQMVTAPINPPQPSFFQRNMLLILSLVLLAVVAAVVIGFFVLAFKSGTIKFGGVAAAPVGDMTTCDLAQKPAEGVGFKVVCDEATNLWSVTLDNVSDGGAPSSAGPIAGGNGAPAQTCPQPQPADSNGFIAICATGATTWSWLPKNGVANMMVCDGTLNTKAAQGNVDFSKNDCQYFDSVDSTWKTLSSFYAGAATVNNGGAPSSAGPQTSGGGTGTTLTNAPQSGNGDGNTNADGGYLNTTDSLDYQDDPAGGCTASANPDAFPACWLQRVQGGFSTPVEAIVAIQNLAASNGVSSFDAWSTLEADEHAPMLVWCPVGDCTWIPDTAFPLMDPRLDTRWHFTVGIIQAHPASDPASIRTITCPAGDCWAVPLH